MDISVIIINYNTFSLTINCIQQIKAKTTRISYEVILVDNASTERDASDFIHFFPEIVLIKNDSNFGFARANNIGIEKSKGEYILLLNSDAFLKNNAIKVTYDFLKKNPFVAVVTGKLLYPNGQIQHNCQRFPSVAYIFFELLRLQKMSGSKIGGRVLFGPFFDYNSIAYPDWVWGTFFMFKKTLIKELPDQKLNDEYFMYGEDMQWCMDFRKLGYEVAFHPNAIIEHAMGASGASKNEMIRKNHLLFLKRNYANWKIAVILFLNKLLKR